MDSVKVVSKKIGGWAILALAFVIPSGLYFLDLAVLSIIGICQILQGDSRKFQQSFRNRRVLIPILFYLYIIAGFFFSKNFGEALSSISEKLPFLLYPLIIGCMANMETEMVQKASNAFILSLSLSLAAAILYAAGDMLITSVYTVQLGESIYHKWNWYGLTRIFKDWHPSYVSAFCNVAIAFLTWPARPYTKTSIGLTLFLSVCIFLLNSITGIIVWCFLILSVVAVWFHRRKTPLPMMLGAGVALMLVLAGFIYFNPLSLDKIDKLKEKGWTATDKQDQRNVLSMRIAKWSTYLTIFRDYPLFGTTAGDIKDIRKMSYMQKGYTDLALYNYNAHDQYLEDLAVYGLTGFAIFLAMLCAVFPDKQSNPLLLPFILITLISFTTESFLERQQGLNFFMFFYSLLSLRTIKSS
jgi:hypothetical protein